MQFIVVWDVVICPSLSIFSGPELLPWAFWICSFIPSTIFTLPKPNRGGVFFCIMVEWYTTFRHGEVLWSYWSSFCTVEESPHKAILYLFMFLFIYFVSFGVAVLVCTSCLHLTVVRNYFHCDVKVTEYAQEKKKNPNCFSLQYWCCAVLAKCIVFVYFLSIPQSNIEECCGFVNIFFSLNSENIPYNKMNGKQV